MSLITFIELCRGSSCPAIPFHVFPICVEQRGIGAPECVPRNSFDNAESLNGRLGVITHDASTIKAAVDRASFRPNSYRRQRPIVEIAIWREWVLQCVIGAIRIGKNNKYDLTVLPLSGVPANAIGSYNPTISIRHLHLKITRDNQIYYLSSRSTVPSLLLSAEWPSLVSDGRFGSTSDQRRVADLPLLFPIWCWAL
jgi:hypothetical protein